jgi:hypothetical protein
LLGAEVRAAEEPMWWTEIRATAAVAEARRLAGSVAGRLIAVLGGNAWPTDMAHTGIVAMPAVEGTAADHGPFDADVITDQGALVIQDRPVVAATTWLTNLMQSAVGSERELQIVTPPESRLTLPLRTLLANLPARWVVRDPDGGYYDGLTGAVLHWHESRFAPAGAHPAISAAFDVPADAQGERQLHLSLRTTHRADEHLLLGGALEAAWQALTGGPPLGWSTAEPVNLPWSPRQLTELARARAEKSLPTWLVAVGAPDRPAIATCRIVRTPAGVEEHITLAAGYPSAQAPPLHALPELAETLAAHHGLASMLTQLRPARADLTTPPHREAPPVPVAYTLGHDAARTHTESAPVHPMKLGPALHYPLGNGTDQAAWHRLKALAAHLNTAR